MILFEGLCLYSKKFKKDFEWIMLKHPETSFVSCAGEVSEERDLESDFAVGPAGSWNI